MMVLASPCFATPLPETYYIELALQCPLAPSDLERGIKTRLLRLLRPSELQYPLRRSAVSSPFKAQFTSIGPWNSGPQGTIPFSWTPLWGRNRAARVRRNEERGRSGHYTMGGVVIGQNRAACTGTGTMLRRRLFRQGF